MTPIYLSPTETAQILDLTAKHAPGLHRILLEKSERDEEQEHYAERAGQELASDELEIDHNPVVSVGEDGAWVLCWNFLYKSDDDE